MILDFFRKRKVVYTIGHSNRKIEEFIKILKKYNVDCVVDVRRFPKSKKFPWFNKENLEKFLKENEILYIHAEELGGFRNSGYLNYMSSSEFKEGMKKLIDIAKKRIVCLMCAEKHFWKCHRRFISKELEKQGFKVFNIKE